MEERIAGVDLSLLIAEWAWQHFLHESLGKYVDNDSTNIFTKSFVGSSLNYGNAGGNTAI